jgi:uncharacterized protein (DUF2345 family)
MSLANTLYDTFYGGNGSISYNSAPTVEYPPSDQVTIFSSLYLPRIYGKDLTAFEIASSGKIALTVRDVHSIAIDRDVAKSNVIIQTMCNDSLLFNVNQSNMTMTFDSASNNVTLYAACNVNMSAGDSFIVNATNLAWNINGDIGFNASNDINMFANSNVNITALNDSIVMAANSSNVTMLFDAATSNLVTYAANNIVSTASNNVLTTAKLSQTYEAQTGSFSVYANESNMSLVMDASTSNITLNTTKTFTSTAADSTYIVASSNLGVSATSQSLTIAAANSNATLVMNHTDYSMTLSSTSNLNTTSMTANVLASSNINLAATSGAVKITAADSNVRLTMDNADYTATLYATSNMSLNTSNNLTLNAQSDVTLTSQNNTTVTSSSNVTLTAQIGSMSLTAVDGQTSVTLAAATSNIDVSTVNSFNVLGASNIALGATTGSFLVSAAQSNMTMTFDKTTYGINTYATSNYSISASNSAFVSAASNVTVSANTGSFSAVANASTMSLVMDAATSNVSLYAGKTVNVTGSNNVVVAAQSNMTLTAQLDTGISANAGVTYMNLNSNDTIVANATTYSWKVGNADMVTIDSTKMVVNGNLQVVGVLDSINVTNTNLLIEDKVISLASGSNAGSNLVDGIANNQAGVIINGVPSGVPEVNAAFFEKSLKWHTGSSGMLSLGSSNINDQESYWELKGGAFRITHNKLTLDENNNVTDAKEISFGFRVNQHDELELVKKYWSGSAYIYKRIAKFGKTLL